MKIGIITFHRADNYGAVLQAYALAKKCETIGQCEIIDFNDSYVNSEYKTIRPIRKEALAKSLIKIAMDLPFAKERKMRHKEFEVFRNKYLPLSKRCNSIDDLSRISNNYDYIITGSDQVWSPVITNGISQEYYLDFGREELKRISYAPSVGNIKQLEGHESEVKDKLLKFSSISARESDACNALSKISGRKVEQVVDPAILLEPNEWISLLSKAYERKKNKNKNKKYIFTYSVSYSPVCKKTAKIVSRETNLPLVNASQITNPFVNRTIFKQGPLGFLSAIKNAEVVITSSFHATVFSLVFHKNLIVIPHRSTGMRVVDLLEKCGLGNRIVRDTNAKINDIYSSPINWDKVDNILLKEREKSHAWLKEALQ